MESVYVHLFMFRDPRTSPEWGEKNPHSLWSKLSGPLRGKSGISTGWVFNQRIFNQLGDFSKPLILTGHSLTIEVKI